MNKPEMILFDYGETPLYEPNLNPDAGNKTIFPYISENSYNVTLDEFNNFLRETFDKIRKLNGGLLEIHEHIFLRYVIEKFWAYLKSIIRNSIHSFDSLNSVMSFVFQIC